MFRSSNVVAVPGRFGSLTALNSVLGTLEDYILLSKGLNGWKVPPRPTWLGHH